MATALAVSTLVSLGVAGAVYQFGGVYSGDVPVSTAAAVGAFAVASALQFALGSNNNNGGDKKKKKHKKSKKETDDADEASDAKKSSKAGKPAGNDSKKKAPSTNEESKADKAKKDAKKDGKDAAKPKQESRGGKESKSENGGKKAVKPKLEEEEDSDGGERFLKLGQKPSSTKPGFVQQFDDEEEPEAAAKSPRATEESEDSEEEGKTEGKISKSSARRRKARAKAQAEAAAATASQKGPVIDKDGFETVQSGKRSKKPAAAAGAAPKAGAETTQQESKGNTDTIELESKQIALLIGKEGETLKKMQTACDVRIETPKRDSGDSTVKISGDPDAVKYAKSQILQLVTKGVCNALTPGITSSSLAVPSKTMAILIGPGGSTLKKVEAACGVKIATPARDSGSDRVTVSGDKNGVKKAKDVIKQLIEHGFSSVTHEGWTVGEVEFPRDEFRVLIGPGGQTIKSIQGDTRTKINIPDPENPNQNVQVVGPTEGVARAIKQISTLLAKRAEKEAAAATAAAYDSQDEDN